MDRFARSAKKGSELVKELIDKGIAVHILNMGLLDNTPASNPGIKQDGRGCHGSRNTFLRLKRKNFVMAADHIESIVF